MDKKRSCCCGALPPMWWWLLTLLGLPLLFFLMVNTRQGEIENDLAGRTTDGLKAAGFDWAQASVAQRGRDVQLQGMAASEEERQSAAKIAQGIYGVRDVQNLIEVAQANAAELPQQAAVDAPSTTQAAAVEPAPSAAAVAAVTQPDISATTLIDQMDADAKAASVAPPTPDAAAKAEPTPAEKAVEEKAVLSCQQQLNDAMSGKTILFETNKSAIKQDSVALLDSLVAIVSSCGDVIAGRGIQVSGHTDNVGNDAYNQKLSQQRAGAVKDYFVTKGIDAGLVKSVGFGESKPIASNADAAGRSQNRRITFDINPE